MKEMMLVVDDNEMNREILSSLFNNKFSIIEAKDGQEALEILERCKDNIDIILLDLVMDNLDGFKVLEIKQANPSYAKIPCVVITASEEVDDQVKAFELGANDYVAKPFVPEVVISRVENVIEAYKRINRMEIQAERLKLKSEIDQLTNLLNKETTEEIINRILTDIKPVLNILLVIDVDNFKSVNDLKGHSAGDRVLKTIANYLSTYFRKSDIIGRIGGDEFVVLLRDVNNIDVIRDKIHGLITGMSNNTNLEIDYNVSLSVGFASNELVPTTYVELFKKADEALYLAKKGGKSRYHEYGIEANNNRIDGVNLICSNRSIVSSISSLFPQDYLINAVTNLDYYNNEFNLLIIDIDEIEMFTELKSKYDLSEKTVIAICKEGNLSQYKEAISINAKDIITTPLEPQPIKRRINVWLGE